MIGPNPRYPEAQKQTRPVPSAVRVLRGNLLRHEKRLPLQAIRQGICGLLLSILWGLGAEEALAVPVAIQFTAPCYDAAPANSDTVCGYTQGNPVLTGLKEVRLYVWRFHTTGDTLVLVVPLADSMACRLISLDLDIAPGSMGEAMITSADHVGNESCLGSHYVFAVPAQEFFGGLYGAYFDSPDFSGFRFTRTDPTVNFNWGSAAPDTGMGPDTYSIRWTGQIRASITGDYQFCIEGNDGARMWLNGVQILNHWTNGGLFEECASVTLQAGSENDVTLDYFEDTATARCILRWIPPGGVKAVIPVEALTH